MLNPIQRSLFSALKPSFLILSLTVFLILGLVFTAKGKLHPDEGNYLMSAYSVGNGLLPYKDFAFTQGPVYPILFSAVGKYSGYKIGRFRFTNLFLHFILVFVLSLSVFQRYRWHGLFIFLIIYLSNVFNFYCFTINKLYLLAGFFVSLGAILLYRWQDRNWALMFSSIFLCFASGVRISIFFILITFLVFTLAKTRDKRTWFFFALIPSILVLSFLYLPFLIESRENTIFYLFTFHLSRELPAKMQLLFKIDFVIAMLKFYGPCILVALSYILWRQYIEQREAYLRFLALAYLIYLVVHIPAKLPYIHEYLSIVFPLLALWLTGVLSLLYLKLPSLKWRFLFMSLLFLFFAFAAVIEAKTFVAPSDNIPLIKIKRVADRLREETKDGDRVFSFNPAITILANREILKGSESSGLVFSLDRSRAEKLNLLHYKDFIQLLQNRGIDALVITPITFDIAFPECYGSDPVLRKEIWDAVNENYILKDKFPVSGLGEEEAQVWLPKR